MFAVKFGREGENCFLKCKNWTENFCFPRVGLVFGLTGRLRINSLARQRFSLRSGGGEEQQQQQFAAATKTSTSTLPDFFSNVYNSSSNSCDGNVVKDIAGKKAVMLWWGKSFCRNCSFFAFLLYRAVAAAVCGDYKDNMTTTLVRPYDSSSSCNSNAGNI